MNMFIYGITGLQYELMALYVSMHRVSQHPPEDSFHFPNSLSRFTLLVRWKVCKKYIFKTLHMWKCILSSFDMVVWLYNSVLEFFFVFRILPACLQCFWHPNHLEISKSFLFLIFCMWLFLTLEVYRIWDCCGFFSIFISFCP